MRSVTFIGKTGLVAKGTLIFKIVSQIPSDGHSKPCSTVKMRAIQINWKHFLVGFCALRKKTKNTKQQSEVLPPCFGVFLGSQIQFTGDCLRHPGSASLTMSLQQLAAPALGFNGLKLLGGEADTPLTTINTKALHRLKLWVGITKG